jgi:hypothetical protein
MQPPKIKFMTKIKQNVSERFAVTNKAFSKDPHPVLNYGAHTALGRWGITQQAASPMQDCMGTLFVGGWKGLVLHSEPSATLHVSSKIIIPFYSNIQPAPFEGPLSRVGQIAVQFPSLT